MKKQTVTQLRLSLADSINRVAYGGERITIHRHGTDLVALVPAEDVALLEWLEDEIDVATVRERLADGEEGVPWDDVRKELGL